MFKNIPANGRVSNPCSHTRKITLNRIIVMRLNGPLT